MILSKDEFQYTLLNKKIALSVSEPDNSSTELMEAQKDIVRYLFNLGAELLYGGDLRNGNEKQGITRDLLNIIQSVDTSKYYNRKTLFKNYLAGHLYSQLNETLTVGMSEKVDFVKTEMPDDLLFPDPYCDDITIPESKYRVARSLSLMREKINKEADICIIMGGKTDNFTGKYPGVLEEAYTAIKNCKPVFIIGKFGGIAHDIINALQGEEPASMTDKFHRGNRDKADFIDYYNAVRPINEEAISYSSILKFFQNREVSALNNGLSYEDNLKLFHTQYVSEMILLIIKGIYSLQNKYA